MRSVAVVGHIEWVDFIPVDHLPQPGEVVHAHGAFARAAGGGGVAAAVLAELGADVDFFCALGRDAHGKASVQQLRAAGVKVHVAWRPDPTRRAVTMLESSRERTIVTIGERLQPLGPDALEWGALEHCDGVYFTAGDGAALERARAARVLVASPRARAALEATEVEIDALVFSVGDANEVQWAQRVAPRARVLVGTDGARGGSWWGESHGSWKPVPPPGAPRDSYGCGDSFAAGFTFALATGRSIAEAAALGALRGAICLTRIGAP